MASTIEQKVMGSVAVIHTFRRATSATALKVYTCVVSLYGLGSLVWVSKVWGNMANMGPAALLQFWVSAFVQTDLAVQVLFVAMVVSAVWLAFDMARSFAQPEGRLA